MTASLEVREAMLAALPNLRAFAMSLTHNLDAADDLVQDTILRAWKNIDRFEAGTNLRVCPGSFCCVREPSEHKANGSQVQEGESLAAEALPVLGQPTAAVQPSYGAFDNPALRQDREALGLIGSLDDLHTDAAADASQTLLELRPLIAAVGVKLEQKRVQPE